MPTSPPISEGFRWRTLRAGTGAPRKRLRLSHFFPSRIAYRSRRGRRARGLGTPAENAGFEPRSVANRLRGALELTCRLKPPGIRIILEDRRSARSRAWVFRRTLRSRALTQEVLLMSGTSFLREHGAADAPPVRAGRGGLGRGHARRAGDRARPEPQREAQHRHDRRGRPGRLQPAARSRSENIVALCDVSEPAIDRAAATPSAGPPAPRLPQALRPRRRVRRGRREHDRAHARLRHAAGLATGQARLLREAADAQHLGGPRSSARRPPRPRSPPRWARRSTPATTTAASSS